jgi:2-dehydropantoate 2-reductase
MTPAGEEIANNFAGLLSSVDLKTEAPGEISSYIWEKSILNSAMAPCAIAQLTMKTVIDSPETVKIVKATIDESVCVAEAEGIKFREDFSNYCIKYLKAAGHHRTSMAVDLANGRLTEIDYLNGRIAWYGRKHGIPTPLNWFITVIIQLMEQQRDESSKDRE